MITEQLLPFIKEQLQRGVSKDAIIAMLSGQGWASVDIEQAFAAVNPSPVPLAPAPTIAPAYIITPTITPTITPAVTAPVQNIQPVKSQMPPVQQKLHSTWKTIIKTMIILVIISLIITGVVLYIARQAFFR